MTVWDNFLAFWRAQRDHGALTGSTTIPGDDGYTAEAACPCGARWSGSVTLREAIEELMRTPLASSEN